MYIQCKFCFKDKVTITVDGKNCPIVKTPFVDGQQFTGTSTGNDTVIICKGPEGFGRNVPLIIKKVARTSPEYSISYSPPEIIDSTPSSWQSQTDVCGKDSLYLGMCAKTDNTTIITFKGKNFGINGSRWCAINDTIGNTKMMRITPELYDPNDFPLTEHEIVKCTVPMAVGSRVREMYIENGYPIY